MISTYGANKLIFDKVTIHIHTTRLRNKNIEFFDQFWWSLTFCLFKWKIHIVHQNNCFCLKIWKAPVLDFSWILRDKITGTSSLHTDRIGLLVSTFRIRMLKVRLLRETAVSIGTKSYFLLSETTNLPLSSLQTKALEIAD